MLKMTSWFCQGLRRSGAGNFKHISSNQSEWQAVIYDLEVTQTAFILTSSPVPLQFICN